MFYALQGKKNKKYFWVPAIAPIISVILSTFFVYITHADKQGVQIVSTQVTIVNAQFIVFKITWDYRANHVSLILRMTGGLRTHDLNTLSDVPKVEPLLAIY
jgi:uncharacterized membrane protein